MLQFFFSIHSAVNVHLHQLDRHSFSWQDLREYAGS